MSEPTTGGLRCSICHVMFPYGTLHVCGGHDWRQHSNIQITRGEMLPQSGEHQRTPMRPDVISSEPTPDRRKNADAQAVSSPSGTPSDRVSEIRKDIAHHEDMASQATVGLASLLETRTVIQTAAGPQCSLCGRGDGVWLAPDESPCRCLASPSGTPAPYDTPEPDAEPMVVPCPKCHRVHDCPPVATDGGTAPTQLADDLNTLRGVLESLDEDPDIRNATLYGDYEVPALRRVLAEVSRLTADLREARDMDEKVRTALGGPADDLTTEEGAHVISCALTEVTEENERLTSALSDMQAELSFYADERNWRSPSTGFALQYDREPSPIQRDRGARARALLNRAAPTPPEPKP